MDRFVIIADATCDLEEELQRQADVRVVPGHVRYPDGSEKLTLPGWENTTAEEFYAELKKDPNAYTTSPANVVEFEQVLTKCVEDGEEVLLMTISSGISGAYDFARQARENVLKAHPEAHIRVVDTLRFGPGFGRMVLDAAEKRAQGMNLDDTADWIERNKNRYHQAGWLDDLSFVAKKGRLTHAKAFFGTLAGVKPIGEFDYNGLTTVIGKAKGAKAAYAALLDYIDKTIENPEEQTIFVAHTCRRKEAEEYRGMIEARFHPKAVVIKDVHPLCGINIGPGLMAAYYIGKPITHGLDTERGILEAFLSGGETK